MITLVPSPPAAAELGADDPPDDPPDDDALDDAPLDAALEELLGVDDLLQPASIATTIAAPAPAAMNSRFTTVPFAVAVVRRRRTIPRSMEAAPPAVL
jgi:hypothetical protein